MYQKYRRPAYTAYPEAKYVPSDILWYSIGIMTEYESFGTVFMNEVDASQQMPAQLMFNLLKDDPAQAVEATYVVEKERNMQSSDPDATPVIAEQGYPSYPFVASIRHLLTSGVLGAVGYERVHRGDRNLYAYYLAGVAEERLAFTEAVEALGSLRQFLVHGLPSSPEVEPASRVLISEEPEPANYE